MQGRMFVVSSMLVAGMALAACGATPTPTPEVMMAKPTVTPDAMMAKPTATPEAMMAKPTVTPDAMMAKPTVTPDAMMAKPTVTPDAMMAKPTVTPDAMMAKPTVKPDAMMAKGTPTPDAMMKGAGSGAMMEKLPDAINVTHFVSSSPKQGDIMDKAPDKVQVTFDAPLAAASTLAIDKKGFMSDNVILTFSPDKLTISVAVPASAGNGAYIVTYKACWADGTCSNGQFAFQVGK